MPAFLAASDGFNPSDQKKFFSVGTGCRRAPDGAGKLELSVGVPAWPTPYNPRCYIIVYVTVNVHNWSLCTITVQCAE